MIVAEGRGRRIPDRLASSTEHVAPSRPPSTRGAATGWFDHQTQMGLAITGPARLLGSRADGVER
ncbi:hypothetical protein, partial [Streptomyces tendae]|uniref:hypothetical protein n=1 Tax=Streptomyces tendae TaxID=1932 RepID=UPI003F4CE0DA